MNQFVKKALVALIMLLTLTLSLAAVMPALAAEDETDTGADIEFAADSLTLTYDEGEVRLTVSADALAELLEKRALSKDAIMQFVPDVLAELARERSAAAVKEFLLEYADPQLLLDLIPESILNEYITPELLISTFGEDVLEAAIDFDALFALFEDETDPEGSAERLAAIIKQDGLASILKDPAVFDALITPSVVDTLFAGAEGQAKLESLLTADALAGIVTDEFVTKMLDNDDFVALLMTERFMNYIMGQESLTDELFANSAFLAKLETNAALKNELYTLYGQGKLDALLEKPNLANELAGNTALIDALKANKSFMNSMMQNAALQNLLTGSDDFMHALIENDDFVARLKNDGIINVLINHLADNFKLKEILLTIDEADLIALQSELTAEEIRALATTSVLSKLFTDPAVIALITDDVWETLLAGRAFDEIMTEEYLEDILTESFLLSLDGVFAGDAALMDRIFTEDEKKALIDTLSYEKKLAIAAEPTLSVTVLRNYFSVAQIASCVSKEDMKLLPVSLLSETIGYEELHRHVSDTDLFKVLDPKDVVSAYGMTRLIEIVNRAQLVESIGAVKVFETLDEDVRTSVLKNDLFGAMSTEYITAVFYDLNLVSSVFNTVSPSKIVECIGVHKIIAALATDTASGIERAVSLIGVKRLVELFTYESLLDVLTLPRVVQLIDPNDIYNALSENSRKSLISASVISTYVDLGALAAIIDPADVIGEGKIEIESVLNTVGLPNAIKAVGISNIVEKLGVDRLLTVIDLPALLSNTDIPALLEAVDVKSMIRAADKDTLKDKALSLALRFLSEDGLVMRLNGHTIYDQYALSLSNTQQALIEYLPEILSRLESSVQSGTDGVFAQLDFEISLRGETIRLALVGAFTGDSTRLEKYVTKALEYVHVTVPEYGMLDVELRVPARVAGILARAVDADRIPAELKTKLFSFTDMTVGEGLAEAIGTLTVEEMQTIVDAIDKDKLTELADKAFTSEKLLSILERVKSFVTRALAKVPANLRSHKISDFYQGNGTFVVNGHAEADLLALAKSKVSAVEKFETYLTDTTVSQDIHFTLTLEDVYEITYISNDNAVFTTFLPVGADLSVLDGIEALAPYTAGFRTLDGQVPPEEMPDHDLYLFSAQERHVTFLLHDGTPYKTYTYVVGDTALPEIPAVPSRTHYQAIGWEDFDLTSGENVVVKPIYTPKTYYLTFKADGATVATVPYTVETTTITLPTLPEKAHYTAEWPSIDFKRGGNKDVNAEYTPIVYYIDFYAENALVSRVPYTYEEAPLLPAVPEKQYYTGAWESFELAYSDTQRVNATYIANKYTIEFYAEDRYGIKFFSRTVTYTVNDIENLRIPNVPEQTHYDVVGWESFTPEMTDSQQVKALYTPIAYRLTLFAGLKGADFVAELSYTVETDPAELLLPALDGYAVEGYEAFWKPLTADVFTYSNEIGRVATFLATYTPIEYELKFVDQDGNPIEVLDEFGNKHTYNITDADIDHIAIPAEIVELYKHYDLSWSFTSGQTGIQTVSLDRVAKKYELYYIDADGNRVTLDGAYYTVEMLKNEVLAQLPSQTPDKPGVDPLYAEHYAGAWKLDNDFNPKNPTENATYGGYDQEITVSYKPIDYEIVFYDGAGNVLKVGSYNIEDFTGIEGVTPDTAPIQLPANPNVPEQYAQYFEAKVEWLDMNSVISLFSLRRPSTYAANPSTPDHDFLDPTKIGEKQTFTVTYEATAYVLKFVTNGIVSETTYTIYNFEGIDGITYVPLTLPNHPLIKAEYRQHYTVSAGALDLALLGEEQTLTVTYTAKEYDVIYRDETGAETRLKYSADNFAEVFIDPTNAKPFDKPAVPQKQQYHQYYSAGEWGEPRISGLGNTQQCTTSYTPLAYELIYKGADGTEVLRTTYTIENIEFFFGSATVPMETVPVPANPSNLLYAAHYNGFWYNENGIEGLDADKVGQVQTLTASYTAKVYRFGFKTEDGTDVTARFPTVTYTILDLTKTDEEILTRILAAIGETPADLEKRGYTSAWEILGFDAANASGETVTLKYTKIRYTVSFIADGSQVGLPITFDVESVGSVTAPDVPAKAGYTGAWSFGDHASLTALLSALIDRGTEPYTVDVFAAYTPIGGTETESGTDTESGSETESGTESESESATESESESEFESTYESESPSEQESDSASAPESETASDTEKDDETDSGAETDTQSGAPVPPPADDEDKGGTMPWYMVLLWIVLILLLIGIIILIIIRREKGGDEPTPPTDGDGDGDGGDSPMSEDVAEEENAEEAAEEAPDTEEEIAPAVITEPETEEPEPLAEEPAEVLPVIRTEGKKSYISIRALNDNFEHGEIVTIEALKVKELIPARVRRIKVIDNRGLEKPLNVFAHGYSAGAKEAIIEQGGTATTLR